MANQDEELKTAEEVTAEEKQNPAPAEETSQGAETEPQDTETTTAENAPEEETSAEEPKAEEPVKPVEPTPEQLLAEANDRYLRLRAEFDNYRKRMAREAMETRENAKCATVAEILDVYDFFLLAMSHAEKTNDMNAIQEGMKMIFNEFSKAFERLGVKMLDVVGKDFDSRFHEAVSQAPSDSVPEGKIIQQWKHGFMLGDKLLRPATVVVSSGPAAPAAADTDDTDNNANA